MRQRFLVIETADNEDEALASFDEFVGLVHSIVQHTPYEVTELSETDLKTMFGQKVNNQ